MSYDLCNSYLYSIELFNTFLEEILMILIVHVKNNFISEHLNLNCTLCSFVGRTEEAIKKHTILVHNGA